MSREASSDERYALLNRLADDFADRYRRGQRPSLKEYTDQYPELAEDIRDLFPALVEVEQAKQDRQAAEQSAVQQPARGLPSQRLLGDYRILREVGRGGMGVVYEAEQISLGRRVALKVLPSHTLLDPRHLGRFQREARAAARLHHTNIVPVFGVGEHEGLPYYVMQFIPGLGLDQVLEELCRLRKDFALSPATASTPAQQVSAMQVAQALLTGDFVKGDPTCSYTPQASEPAGQNGTTSAPRTPDPGTAIHLPGQTPQSTLSESGQHYWHSVARVGVQVAEALAYASGQGILHRDIKPSNLLLDEKGNVWITDFGLAKAKNDSDNLTHTGDIIGTLRYMAPERFNGKGDLRSDLYSLGLTLYELLTLRPAFDEVDRNKLIKQVIHDEPPRPRKLEPRIPRDLETIVWKCLAKEPAERYATAEALADDLKLYLADRPIKARPATGAERLWRWSKRNPILATTLATVFTLLFVIAIGGWMMSADLQKALNNAEADRRRAETARLESRLNEAIALIGEAHGIRYSKREGQRFKALAALKKAATIGRELKQPPEWFVRLRNEAIAALALPDLHVTKQWPGWPLGTTFATVSADFHVYGRSDNTGAVSVRRMADDTEVAQLPGAGTRCEITLSRDGADVVQLWNTGEHQSVARLWHLAAKGPRENCRVANVRNVAFMDRPEGRLLVCMHFDSAVSVYQVSTGQRQGAFPSTGHTPDPRFVTHPTEPLIAVSSYYHGMVALRDLRTGTVVSQETAPWRNGCRAAWHPSGRYLCISNCDTSDTRIYHFDPATRRLRYERTIPQCGAGDPVLQFNRNGDRIIISDWGSITQLRDFWTGGILVSTMTNSRAGGWEALPVLSPDGSQLALAWLAEGDGEVGVWSVADARECRPIVPSTAALPNSGRNFALHPGGRIIAQIYGHGVRLFDLQTGMELGSIDPIGARNRPESSICFDAVGNLYTNSATGVFRWPVQADPVQPHHWRIGPPIRLPFYPGTQSLATSANGTVVAQAMRDRYGMQEHAGGWILHPQAPQPHWVEPGSDMLGVTVSPDGRWAAFIVEGGITKLFEAATGKKVWQSPEGHGTRCFSLDSRFLLTSSDLRSRVIALGSWEPGPDLGPGAIMDATADNALAVLTGRGVYRLVEMATGREIARLEDPDQQVGLAQFTTDGTKLVAQTSKGVRVWDLRRIRQELVKLGLDWDAPPYPSAVPEVTQPMEVQIVGAELVTDAKTRDAHERDQLDLHLWLNPLDANAYWQRGQLRYKQKYWYAARDDFSRVLILNPDHVEAYHFRAHAYEGLRLYNKAIDDFTEALNRKPDNAHFHESRAQNYLKCKEYGKAMADFQRSLAIDDRQAGVHHLLARLYVAGPLEQRAPTKALPLIERAVQLAPGEWQLQQTRGMVLYRLHRWQEAVQSLERGIHLHNREATATDLFFLAMCNAHLGDKAKAQDCFDRAVKWTATQKNLTPQYAAELKAFRAEAEAMLKAK